jgi:hypothetical protein
LVTSFVSDGVHLKCAGATHVVDKEDAFFKWEWDEGVFGVVNVEDELESLNKF